METSNTASIRKVMIGTPTYDGKLDVWYTNSLVNTITTSTDKRIGITPIWISYDALIQRARNDIIQTAINLDVDDLIFIDADIEWNPADFFKLLEYPQDVVGGTYPKKTDEEIYVLRDLIPKDIDPLTGLIEVTGLGTGFVKLSRRAIDYLWNSSEMYIDPKDNQERRMVFDVLIKDNLLYSEDTIMFYKLIQGGFKVYLDPKITCNHIGPKKFVGNFTKWLSKINIKRQL